MKTRNRLSLFVLWGVLIVGSGQEPSESAHQLYFAFDSAWKKGDFALSEHYLNRILGDGYQLPDLNIGVVHNALGLVYHETGRLDEAILNFRTALRYSSGSSAESLTVRINIYNNIALLLNWLGDYPNALEHFNKAIRLLDSIPVRDAYFFSQLSMLQFNKGLVYSKLGELEEALIILKESERIKETHQHEYLGSVYFNLAQVYQDLKKSVQSGLYYEKGINQWISEQDTAFFQLANIYLKYGQFLVDQGNLSKGYEYFQKALHNYISNYGVRHPLTAGCYEHIARYHLDQLDFEQGLEYTQLALISGSADFNDIEIFANPSGNNSLHDLTLLKSYASKVRALEELASQDSKKTKRLDLLQVALETSYRSIEVLRRLQESYLSRESRLYLISNQRDLYSTGIRLNITMYHLTEKEEFFEQAFLMSARSKSNELLFEIKAKEWLLLESFNDTLASSVLQLKTMMDRYSNLIQLESQERNPDSARIILWQDKLFRMGASYQVQMDSLSETYPRMGDLESLRMEYSLDQIRRNLKRSETLVEYFMTDPNRGGSKQLYTFVVTRKYCHVFQSLLDSSFFSDLDIIMLSIHEFDPYREDDRSYDLMKKALFGIYQQLVEPVESLIKGKKLVIVPDDRMAFLPFDALIDRYAPDKILDYAGLPYLLHKYEISYSNNSQLIQQPRQPGIGFPDIITWLPEYVSSNEESPWYLDGAVTEVRELLMLLDRTEVPANPGKMELGKLLQEKSILHLAMHAQAGEQTGESPYFLLDPYEDSVLSGRLYDYEINAMNLRSPMVVLSSCRTGSGQLQLGEGIMSLSRSFILAGAGSVVHSLWPIDDPRGPDIMVEFYRELIRGKSKSKALSEAKRLYLINTPPSYTHPYYWASFQLTGNPVSLTYRWMIIWITGLGVLAALSCVYLIRRSFRSRS